MIQNKKWFVAFFIIFIFTCSSCKDSEEMTFTVQEFPQYSMDEEHIEGIKEKHKDEKKEKIVTVYIHICGEVKNPGVYEMSNGSRIVDVVNKAGGLTTEADIAYVNLAEPLIDGSQVYIPSMREDNIEEGDIPLEADDGKVNINLATIEELCSLNGIGEERARTILKYREQNGNFTKIEEIMEVSGIKEGLFEKIKENICVR